MTNRSDLNAGVFVGSSELRQPQRIMAVLTHMGMTLSVLTLLRQPGIYIGPKIPPLSWVDVVLGSVITATVAVAWWRTRAIPREREGALIGIMAGKYAAVFVVAAMVLIELIHRIKTGFWDVNSLEFMFAVMGALVYMAAMVFVAAAAGILTDILFKGIVSRSGKIAPVLGAAFFILSLFIPAGELASHLALGTEMMTALTRNLFVFPIQFDFALSVNGAPVTIKEVVLCERPPSIKNRKSGYSAEWTPGLKSFGHVFADGSGVFLMTPDVCRALDSQQHETDGHYPADRPRPLIGWTRDTSSFDEFDLYLDSTAYSRPNAPLNLNAITVQRISRDTPASEPDTFARVGWTSWGSGAGYIANYGVAFPEEVWSRDPKIASQLAGIDKPTFVLSQDPFPPHSDSPIEWIRSTGATINDRGQSIPENAVSSNWRRQGTLTFFPLRPVGDSWVARTDEAGVLAFHRVQPPARIWHPPASIKIGDRQVAGTPSNYFYDPETKTLVSLRFQNFRFSTGDDFYASR